MIRNRNKSRGEGGGGRRINGAANAQRRMFTKLMKDKNATISSIFQAKRFLEGMQSFESKAELLSRLTDNREHGMQRIQDVLSFTDSVQDVETLFLPFVDNVMNAETNRPTFRPLRNKILLAIYNVPGLLDMLVHSDVTESLDQASATELCLFIQAITKAYLEPRKSETVKELAKGLQLRGDIQEAGILCAFLLADNKKDDVQETKSFGPSNLLSNFIKTACWVTDTNPPGGRHDNDDPNFRNVNIIPTTEELCCVTKPYLPLANGANRMVQDPVTSLLDRNFRLIREDAIASMREKIAESSTGPWTNANIIDLEAGKKGGTFSVSFVVRFERRNGPNTTNWKRSRALMPGSIIALCRDGKPVRMGVISIREDDWLNADDGPKIGVVFENDKDFEDSMLEVIQNGANKNQDSSIQSYDLSEVSKSFFAYQPILDTLQKMDTVPLGSDLCGTGDSEPTSKPSYLPDGIKLPSGSEFNGYTLSLSETKLSDLEAKTTLDRSQAAALHHALTERVALVQGPPGCGKTFIGSLIARVIRQNTDESIVCVCYTNHALDQFLEHMLEYGEKRLVRIGGRSKSQKLSPYGLKHLARHKSDQQSYARRRMKQVYAQLCNLEKDISKAKAFLAKPISWTGNICIRNFLEYEEPDIFESLRVPESSEGFQLVGPGGKKIGDDFLWDTWRKGGEFPAWLRVHQRFNEHEKRESFQEFWSLSGAERHDMIGRWRREIIDPSLSDMNMLVTQFRGLTKEMQSLSHESDQDILRDARIIGATTSGAAKHWDILSEKAAGVVIVEEAGEVLEGHILASLTANTKHLIMIGDHKQLRPKVETHALTTTSGSGYNLDCSLFERLVLEEHSSVSLEVQHRMRPSISALIRHKIYPNLKDHESVFHFPDVKGVSENLVFIDHRYKEEGGGDEGTTRSNSQEAMLAIEVVRYLLLQGYKPEQLVVLTPYLGQLNTILGLMKSSLKEVSALVDDRDMQELENLEGGIEVMSNSSPDTKHEKRVRVSSVDNFQGEEADIPIIALVRSNPQGNIGFLKEEQRVNVLLSRARHGMVIIGNSATLAASKKGYATWKPILDQLRTQGLIKDGLPTLCQLHPSDRPITLTTPREFRQARPNGGCDRPCTMRLSCGHACPMMCHPVDRDHKKAHRLCIEPCRRIPDGCRNNHLCPKRCNEHCGPCRKPVDDPITLSCGHIFENPMCYETCSEDVKRKLALRCEVCVSHSFAKCGHKAEIPCFESRKEKPRCPKACGQFLPCGHSCTNICGSCRGGHSCGQKCERMLFCGHACNRPCHAPDSCQPCGKRCEATCVHSRCAKICSVPCASCVEACDWGCSHQGTCKLVCGAPCSRLPCNERCTKRLECGHRCPSICGEACPNREFCHLCGDTAKKSQVVDMISCSSYQDHDVDEDPVIVLPCGHFFSASTLDGHLEISKVYLMENDKFIGLKQLKGNDIGEKPKVCIDCRAPIHSIPRYGRILRLTELRSLERKHMMQVDRILKQVTQDESTQPLAVRIKSLREIERTIRKSPMNTVYDACGGSEEVETSPPPAVPLIQCLFLQAKLWSESAKALDDSSFKKANSVFKEAINVADSSSSIRSGGELRIVLAKLYVKCSPNLGTVSEKIKILLDWVLEHCVNFSGLIAAAEDLKQKMEQRIDMNELREVVKAMRQISGYDYGGTAADHWYECPNGHPYFIGECGGAMQTAQCPECGETVGGTGHNLLQSNRQAGGQISQALRR